MPMSASNTSGWPAASASTPLAAESTVVTLAPAAASLHTYLVENSEATYLVENLVENLAALQPTITRLRETLGLVVAEYPALRRPELTDELRRLRADLVWLPDVLPLLAENGLVIADNVLWSGRVVEPDGDESTQAIKAFNEHVRSDDRVVSVMLTVRDGMTLVQKR